MKIFECAFVWWRLDFNVKKNCFTKANFKAASSAMQTIIQFENFTIKTKVVAFWDEKPID